MDNRYGYRYGYPSANYNMLYPPAAAPSPVTAPPPPTTTSQIIGLFSKLLPINSDGHISFSIPALPVKEVLGGTSSIVRGLVLTENWWVALLIIFLFFPKVSSKMFGRILRE